jgi:hypothetical protein
MDKAVNLTTADVTPVGNSPAKGERSRAVTPYILCTDYQSFREIYCFHLKV